jgi:hypothetical protein
LTCSHVDRVSKENKPLKAPGNTRPGTQDAAPRAIPQSERKVPLNDPEKDW